MTPDQIREIALRESKQTSLDLDTTDIPKFWIEEFATRLIAEIQKASEPAAPAIPDAVLKDAERYRWFRGRCLWDADAFPWPVGYEYPEEVLDDHGMMLDAAIDAAIAEVKK